jgi:hypothetical protein
MISVTLIHSPVIAQNVRSVDITGDLMDIESNEIGVATSLSDVELLSDDAIVIENGANDRNLEQNIKAYQASIGEQEALYGAYHPLVGEQLLGLGLLQQNNALYSQAVETLTRALHITRVNEGLETLNQLPIIENLITSNTELGNWEALDQNFSYFYWLNKRAYGVNDPRLLPVINRVAAWNIDAYSKGISTQPFGHLLMAEQMYENGVSIIENKFGEYDSRLIDYFYGIALANYEQAIHANSVEDFEEILHSSRNSNSGAERLIQEQNARTAMIGLAYRDGKRAMERILNIFQNNSSLPSDAHAMAHLHMGDWFLMFNKNSTARDAYNQAYALMDKVDLESRDRIFNRPRSLPALKFLLEKDRDEKDVDQYVIASFDVTEAGKTRNVEILEVYPPDDVSLERRAKKTLRSARFRPRYEDGQAVESTGVSIRYVFE